MGFQWLQSPKAQHSPISLTLACPTNDSPQYSIPAFLDRPLALTGMNLFTALLQSTAQPGRLSNGLTILQIHSL
ncbi:hypothetical protein EEB11_03970 [Pseudotabrizicola sediminis]|uniref:Uncharacterized protein n=1 Tax=Pseudotabrizicola sediminis TaxID=2486418 RepID=A0ABY2KPU9_9RHOB|nr:hypothetical protein EEB11_03970 [Pseudotabrizicola sediminis]